MDGLEYQHDGSGEPDDFILLQAGDSQSLQNVLLPVSVEVNPAVHWKLMNFIDDQLFSST